MQKTRKRKYLKTSVGVHFTAEQEHALFRRLEKANEGNRGKPVTLSDIIRKDVQYFNYIEVGQW